ncbi:snRNA-activating protein complex subunit 5 isoform X1 [Onychostruthus taczanowskii]|uniref:snRNA-activating protein complex subunit 5 isoform X1 n=1 Tax=Onychostruthus taczanowskii TaxID=356909 RepID=UPI001B8041E1|nr:snRNA-activating protein complex subunit 5 isoform X1 [Onychostruthus taczanowskii]XP_041274256.1 snRNA-activating protein complex subunit 5 isoform X1 [Onychostruthus taczanowskii]
MLSRLQELRREEETLLRVKAALHDQLRRLRDIFQRLTAEGRAVGRQRRAGCARCRQCSVRSLQVEELALQSMIRAGEENVPVALPALAEDTQQTLGQMDNEAAINQTELHLSLRDDKEEEEEEEEESDS